MSGVIHFKRTGLIILCIPLLLLVLVLVFHENIFDTPSGKRRILQAELHERLKVFNNATLKHMPIFKGGIPRRIVIFSDNYSGYEFMEEILLTIPGVFIHKTVTCDAATDASNDRDWSSISSDYRDLLVNETLKHKIYPLLNCKSSEHQTLVGSSSIISSDVEEYCKENPSTCSSEYFQRQLCEMSSIQILVLKNFDFHMALHMKDHKHLHLVYMIRDPRSISLEQTDLHHGSCPNFTHCFDVSDVCRSMRNSEDAIKSLVQKRHKQFKILRLDDLAYNMMPEMDLMFNDWGITHTPETYNVMNEAKSKIDNMTFEWDRDKKFAEIDDIQEKCRSELSFYAYKIFENEKELESGSRPMNDLASRLKEIEAEGY